MSADRCFPLATVMMIKRNGQGWMSVSLDLDLMVEKEQQ